MESDESRVTSNKKASFGRGVTLLNDAIPVKFQLGTPKLSEGGVGIGKLLNWFQRSRKSSTARSKK